MGGEYRDQVFPDMREKELKDAFAAAAEEQLEEYLHKRDMDRDEYEGYSGTFAEKDELTILPDEFVSEKQARSYMLKYNDMQGPAHAAKLRIDGKRYWMVGGWCSS